ncbi:MAG: DUF933 domain-containing protein [Chloroflexota bacterium]
MSLDFGIIGLAGSGRTTVFSALTGVVTSGGQESSPRIATAKVPDSRLGVLADMFPGRKVVPAEARYLDIGASLKTLAEGGGIGGKLLGELSQVDALLEVVRAFQNDRIPLPEGGLDVGRDISSLNSELAFSDLLIIERRLERLEVSLRSAKPADRTPLVKEQTLLLRLKKELEGDRPLRELSLSPEEARVIANYQFLTAKPLLIVINIGEKDISRADAVEAELKSRYSRPGCLLTALCAGLESELAQLDSETQLSLRAEYGLKESGRDRVIRLSYELLGLVSFLTVVGDEIRAWPIPNGTIALKAAGKVHTDMERGFIRAEVVSFADLVASGSLAEARKRGLLRAEGKNYVVKDGDVINFLFNV